MNHTLCSCQVLKIINQYRHTTSIFDDFLHYEKRQEETETRRNPGPPYKVILFYLFHMLFAVNENWGLVKMETELQLEQLE